MLCCVTVVWLQRDVIPTGFGRVMLDLNDIARGRNNNMKSLMIVALLGIAATAHAAQFYEWVDEKGVKQYTQQPPPANVKQVQQRRLGTNVIETSGPTFSLQQAVKNFPVTLYVTDCGEVCKTAR